jgi:hypothetical protein
MGAAAHAKQASTAPWESACYVLIPCPMLVTVGATISAQIHQIVMDVATSATDLVLIASVYRCAPLERRSADLEHLMLPARLSRKARHAAAPGKRAVVGAVLIPQVIGQTAAAATVLVRVRWMYALTANAHLVILLPITASAPLIYTAITTALTLLRIHRTAGPVDTGVAVLLEEVSLVVPLANAIHVPMRSATYPTVWVEHYHTVQIRAQTSTTVGVAAARVLAACTMRVRRAAVFARTQCAMVHVWTRR